MIDKTMTCQCCPDRRPPTEADPGCRHSCSGWQAREAAKKEEYARRLTALRAVPERAFIKKQKNESSMRVLEGKLKRG